MIRFGPGRDIDLSMAGRYLGARYRPELLAQNDRARGLWSRLYQQNEPGCLLADEVGKGKTYVALAVAFARLAAKPKGHILILTHSGHMAQIWKRRWKEVGKCVSSRWKDRWGDDGWSAIQYWSVDDLDYDAQERNLPQVAFASYETLKKYASDTHDGGYLLDALCRSERFIGICLRPDERNALIKDMFDCDLRSIRRRALPDAQTRRILSWLDPETRCWKDDAYYNIDDELDNIQARCLLNHGVRFDLLIVDEAHKLEGTARHRVVARLLRSKAARVGTRAPALAPASWQAAQCFL